MAVENGQRAVDLLGQNDAGELVGQRDGSKREQQAGARTGCSGPAVGRADGEHQRLRAVVAQAANLRGELLRRELPAPAVEQDESGHSTGGLAIQPCQQRGLGAVRLGLAGEEARGAGKKIRCQSSGSAGLGARAGWGDGREDKLHPMRVLQDVKEKHPRNMDYWIMLRKS